MSARIDRCVLVVDGVAVLDYVPTTQDRPVADDARVLVDVGAAVPAVLDRLAGHWVSSENDELVDALLSAGASPVRHAHVFALPLPRRDRPQAAVSESLRAGPIGRAALDLAELAVRAYPVGHVDFETASPEEAAIEIGGLLDGTLLGPFLRAASGQVLDADRVVAVCIVNRVPGEPPWGGPWVSEVFRAAGPAYRGLGAVLLLRAIAALEADGEVALSLAVTDGNPAIDVYRSLGFEHVTSRRKVAIPERWSSAASGRVPLAPFGSK